MPDYIDLDIGPVDAEQLRQQGRDYMAAQAPAGWVINPWLDWLLGAVARMAVLVLVLAGQVPLAIFKYFGVSIAGVPTISATSATGSVTFHLLSNPAGVTIDAGANIDVDGVAFETTVPLVMGVGVLNASVTVVAQTAGSSGSGLTGATVDLIFPSLTIVDSVTLDAVTTGGVDEEGDTTYANRLADEMTVLSPKAIVSDDAATIARRDPEVFRALAIDNFVPPSTTGVAGAITVAVMNDQGTNTSSGAHTRIETALETGRILAIDAHLIDPTYNAIDVAFTAQCYADAIPSAVAADAKAAIQAFLSPLQWGIPSDGTSSDWVDEPKVVRNDLYGVLYSVPGIRHVSALTIAAHAGTLATSDITMTGPAAVPTIASADIAATVAV